MKNYKRKLQTVSHWGAYTVEVSDDKVVSLNNFKEDTDPSSIGQGIIDVIDGPTRIKAPMVRESWLNEDPKTRGTKRGKDKFIEVSWEQANQLVADELNRVKSYYGNKSIYAGSYGWASAGRFHHAQSQLKRFLNCIGGFTSSKNTYSYGAAEVVVPHILGSFSEHLNETTSWKTINSNCELFVAFGGIPLKNGQISQGGTGHHIQKACIQDAYDSGVDFVNISPQKSDLLEDVNAQWVSIRPNTDVALILGLSHTILSESLEDRNFIDKYTVGYEKFSNYINGLDDGVEKTADWASLICDIPADSIRKLARRMATSRTMISTAWALTRQDHGEQPFWAAIALASIIGQIGLPGTGIGFGYSAVNNIGLDLEKMKYASFPQGNNPIKDFIPVARFTEMLEKPGQDFDYNGKSYKYPDIKLIWWAGGNPFHHHQDLNRMTNAWQKPETIIVNEWCWNALAKHADIILPCTTSLERSDIALTPKDPYLMVMYQVIKPVGKARNDHEIFRGIASKMNVEKLFTEDKTEEQWKYWIWEESLKKANTNGVFLPDWETFQSNGWFKTEDRKKPIIMMEAFRKDPKTNPLKTPSGKIEIFSEVISSFSYDDCLGHPAWLEPVEWLGNARIDELHMISNQPHNKLHSQLDHGSFSQADRPNGVEKMTINPKDAKIRNLSQGEIVRIYNQRGSCLAELNISDDIRNGVIQIATGAWYNPDGSTCKSGNPNVLTLDKGTSKLAQGPIAQSCLVRIGKYKN